MPIYNKLISSLLLILLIAIPTHGYAEINSFASAINEAGRQRMLSQQIVANYSQVGQNIQKKKSKQQLIDAIIKFDELLKDLMIHQPSGKINKQLKRVNELWLQMRLIAQAPVQRSNAEELEKQAEKVLRASHRVVIMLQDKYNSTHGELVNISGRQRMLSQRLSKLYMLQSWGFSSSEYSSDYSQAINEFKGGLSILIKSGSNTPKIKKELNKVRKEFAILEKSTHQEKGVFIPLMVKMSADKLLKLMDEITHLYEQLE